MKSASVYRWPHYWGMLLLVLGAMFLSGCATQEKESLSARPWNTPKNWEHGMPTGMMEGR